MAENVFSDLSRMIEQVGKDKGIDKQVVIDAVVQGMLVAARKKYGTYREIEAQYNEETGEVELYEFKEVVKPEDFIDEEIEIVLDEARELNPDIPLPLENAILRCLDRDPEKRYPIMSVLVRELQTALYL